MLASVLSKEDMVREFRANEMYKQEIVSSRVAAVTTYKGSEEFDEELTRAAERGVADFKGGPEAADERKRVQEAATAEYQRSVAFKHAVVAEAEKMSVQLVGCCREFFKDNMRRPTREFGGFFGAFIRSQRDCVAAESSMKASGSKPPR